MPKYTLLSSDNKISLPVIPRSSIDAVVCDPPYGLVDYKTDDVADCLKSWLSGEEYVKSGKGFMDKDWDSWIPGPETWSEVYRVLKPGGHLLSFAGTRTLDLMGLSIRLAGFELRDEINLLSWIRGSGMPKNHDIGKAVKRSTGDDRWSGYGTALKPLQEPILVFRKPFDGSVDRNMIEYGTGGINIDACRVKSVGTKDKGRWPPNVILVHHQECKQIGTTKEKGYMINRWNNGAKPFGGGAGLSYDSEKMSEEIVPVWDCHPYCSVRLMNELEGKNVAKFFPQFHYCKKALDKERSAGCSKQNKWPTVKPVRLMRWLVKLVCPGGGTTLDPFMGTGTTGVACAEEGISFVGIEQDIEAYQIAEERIKHAYERLS